jgi:hypothetical protein
MALGADWNQFRPQRSGEHGARAASRALRARTLRMAGQAALMLGGRDLPRTKLQHLRDHVPSPVIIQPPGQDLALDTVHGYRLTGAHLYASEDAGSGWMGSYGHMLTTDGAVLQFEAGLSEGFVAQLPEEPGDQVGYNAPYRQFYRYQPEAATRNDLEIINGLGALMQEGGFIA